MVGARLHQEKGAALAMTDDFRWNDYFLRGAADVESFWKDLLAEEERRLLFVLGHGFDQRMCHGLRTIVGTSKDTPFDALVIEYDEGPRSHSHQYSELRERNGERLEALLKGRGKLARRRITMFNDGRRVGARSITNEFQSMSKFRSYSDVVVDISALPRGLYFPLLSKLLLLFDQDPGDQSWPNLHVVVAHSPGLDQRIVDEGVEENASFLHGFSAASFEREATREQPRIWIPLLGRRQTIQLERIYELVSPDEICPLLPSPAHNPREADDLVLEYREFLFDQLRVEPQNIIYASESNPFEVYRQLMRSIVHYREALEPLSGCKAVLSALSSKLLSLGALLAAYELSRGRTGDDHVDVGVAHVDTQGYRLEDAEEEQAVDLYSLWLCGECYEGS